MHEDTHGILRHLGIGREGAGSSPGTMTHPRRQTVRLHTRRLRMPERQRMTTRLKTLFQRPELFVLAGGINPIGARMAEALGYDAFYMSGGNTSGHQLGWPDSGTSMRDMV